MCSLPPHAAERATAALEPRALHCAFHGREVLAAAALPYPLALSPRTAAMLVGGSGGPGTDGGGGGDAMAGSLLPCLLATASEDNTVRLSRLSLRPSRLPRAPGGLHESLAVLEGHPAAVRALALSPSIARGRTILFSAGVKEVIQAWAIETMPHGGATLCGGSSAAVPGAASDAASAAASDGGAAAADGAPGGDVRSIFLCSHAAPERNSHAAKAAKLRRDYADSDSRYFAAAAAPLPGHEHVLAAATSQGQLDIFVLGESRRTLQPLARFAAPAGAILCLAILPLPPPDAHHAHHADGTAAAGASAPAAPPPAPPLLLVGGDTNGGVSVWDLTELLDRRRAAPGSEQALPRHADATAGAPPQHLEFEPLCRQPLHAFGTNCLSIAPLPAGAAGAGTAGAGTADFVIVSAGDDEAVGLCVLRVAPPTPPSARREAESVEAQQLAPRAGWGGGVALRALGTRAGAHSAAIRGVEALGSLVITAGCDQRLNAWRWDVPLLAEAVARVDGVSDEPNAAAAAPAWPLRLCASRTTSVQDVHGLCVCAQQHKPPRGAPSEAAPRVAVGGPPAEASGRGERGAVQIEVVAVAVVGDGVEIVAFAC